MNMLAMEASIVKRAVFLASPLYLKMCIRDSAGREETLLRLCHFNTCFGSNEKHISASIPKNAAGHNARDLINGVF